MRLPFYKGIHTLHYMWPGNEIETSLFIGVHRGTQAAKDTSSMAIIARQASREKTDVFMSV